MEQPAYSVVESQGASVTVCAVLEVGQLDQVNVTVELTTQPDTALESGERERERDRLSKRITTMDYIQTIVYFQYLALYMYVFHFPLIHLFHFLFLSVDYSPLIAEFLSFGPGQERQCTDIRITDNDITEAVESFTVQLRTTSDLVTIDSLNSSTISIFDNDCEQK